VTAIRRVYHDNGWVPVAGDEWEVELLEIPVRGARRKKLKLSSRA
jgi:hypothetical protein